MGFNSGFKGLTRNCGTKQSAGTHTNTRKWIPIKNTGC